MLVDTHAHLWWDCYADNLEQVLERAKAAGVEKIIVPGTDEATSQQSIELAKKNPGVIYAAVGIHPEGVVDARSQVTALRDLLTKNRKWIVAVGEIGTDVSTGELKSKIGRQQILFEQQVQLALEFDLPIIVHTRESLGETLAVLDQTGRMPRGVFHCFSYDEAGLAEVLARGFMVALGGNLTWSKRLQKLVDMVPGERLLLETDSPLMTPLSKKPEQNEPANVRITAQLMADLRGLTLEALGEQTTRNAEELFKL